MSHDSYLCGYIKTQGDFSLVRALIDKLPTLSEDDEWPYLTSSMFSCTNSPEYRDRIIHFAASYKDIMSDWNVWKHKFEEFVDQFDFDEIKIFIEDCYQGDFIALWLKSTDKEGKEMVLKEQKKLDYEKQPNIEFL